MKKADLAVNIFAALRKMRAPSLNRFTILAAVARRPGMNLVEICADVGAETRDLHSSIDHCARLELVVRDSAGRYHITPEGEDQLLPLFNAPARA